MIFLPYLLSNIVKKNFHVMSYEKILNSIVYQGFPIFSTQPLEEFKVMDYHLRSSDRLNIHSPKRCYGD